MDLGEPDEALSSMEAQAPAHLRALFQPDIAPSVQSVPSTLAAVNTLSGATFTEWWICNGSSGNLTGANGTTLTAGGGTFRYSRVVPGWSGSDMVTGYKAIEFLGTDATPQAFAAAANGTYDLTASITIVGCGRLLRPPGGNRSIVSKWLNDTTAGGYRITASSTGVLAGQVRGSAATINVSGPGVVNELDSIGNGAVMWFALKIDATSGFATMMADRAAGTPVALPAGAVVAIATPFRVGGAPTLFSCELFQMIGFGVLAGAAAEAFTITNLLALDNWARPPVGSTFLRYSVCAPIVGTDATGVRVQHLAGSANNLHCQFPHESIGGVVGALQERGTESVTSFKCRNRLLQSDDFANAAWTKTNVTAAANAGQDPAGFFGAASLTATAGNGTVLQSFTGEASNDHTVSFFAIRNGGSDVACRLSLYNSAAGTEIAGTNITVTSTWQRFSLAVPLATVGAIATLQWRLTITTNGTSIIATFAQAEYGWLRSYQTQRAALIDRDDNEWAYDNATNQVYDPTAGKVEITVVGRHATINSTGAFIFSTDAGASNEDRVFMQRDALTSTYFNESTHRDSAGTIVAQLTDWPVLTHTSQITYSHEWDSRKAITSEGVRVVDVVGGTTVRTGATVAAAAWTPGANADRIMLGSRHSLSAHLEGIVVSFRSWGRV